MKGKSAVFILLVISTLIFTGCGNTMTVEDSPAPDRGSGKSKEDVWKSLIEEAETPEGEDTSKKSKDVLLGSGEGAPELISTYFDNSKYMDDGGSIYFQCFGNHILTTEASGQKYPRLSETLKAMADEEERTFKEEVVENDREALEFAKQMQGESGGAYYSRYAEDFVKRIDDKCLSILRITNGFLGGAHPDYTYETYNIDVSTGKLVCLSDVIADKEKLDGILIKKLKEEYSDVEFFGLEDSFADYRTDMILSGEDQEGNVVYAYDFTLDPDGISFYFSPYGISPYAFGDQVVKILYDEEPELFKGSYAVEGAYISYITELDNKCGINGKTEKVHIARDDYDESGSFGTLIVEKGEASYEIKETDCYNQTSFIVHTASGKDYLYSFVNMVDDMRELYVTELGGSTPVRVKPQEELYYNYRDYYDAENSIYGVYLPIYPEEMDLAIRCDLLSTYSAYAKFEAGSDGIPVQKDKYLTIPEDLFVLTSKAALDTPEVDEEGNVKDKPLHIAMGEDYTLYRTDGKGIVDAKLKDGKIVRLEVSEEFPHKVNGVINEEKLFDGMHYAG